jgi:SET domain
MEASDSLKQLQEEIYTMQNLLGEFRDCRCLSSDTPSILTNWIGPVETFVTLNKGRGVRATRDIAPLEVILVQRPIASAAFHEGVDRSMLFSVDKKVDCNATVKLKGTLVNRAERDGIVSQIVGRLSDGTSNLNNPLVPLRDLMLNFDSCPLLLPGHHDYLEGDTRLLTAEQISKIVSTNVHGGEKEKRRNESNLYPAIAMMNHTKHANAEFVPLQGKSTKDVAVVATVRLVKKGEELCMQYLPDEAKVKANWGTI